MSYLKNPILNKITRSGVHWKFSWGSCLMHNYRQTMQDHLIVNPKVNQRFSLFAVLDGFDSDIFSKYVGNIFERNFKTIQKSFYLIILFGVSWNVTFVLTMLEKRPLATIKIETERVVSVATTRIIYTLLINTCFKRKPINTKENCYNLFEIMCDKTRDNYSGDG